MPADTATNSYRIDPRLLQRLKTIELRSRYLVSGLYANRHRTAQLGASTEFVDHRAYRWGDELRTIYWRVFGRTERFFVKRFEMEANLRVHILLDTSASMRVEPDGDLPGKLDLACVIAGAIATMAVTQQNAAGLTCIGDRVEEHIPAKQGMAHLSLLYQHLSQPRGRGGGRFGELVSEVADRMPPRGVTFVITDALDDVDALTSALKGLRVRGHDVTLIHVLDRDEMHFPFDQLTQFRDPESELRVVGDASAMRQRYLSRLNAYLERIDSACKPIHVDLVRLTNADDLTALLPLHMLRRLMAGGARA